MVALARVSGCRKYRLETKVPTRISLVSRAMRANVVGPSNIRWRGRSGLNHGVAIPHHVEVAPLDLTPSLHESV